MIMPDDAAELLMNPYESKKLSESEGGIAGKPRRTALWARWLAGVIASSALAPTFYVVFFLWKMFCELTGDRTVEGYTNIPTFLFVGFTCFAINILLVGCTTVVEQLGGEKGSRAFDFTHLAMVLSPWPLLIGYLGFVFVLASTGARWGS